MFPVSFITPRNLYTYTYTFSNVGMYGDGSLRGKLGRILGDDNAVIRENKRTCFYEVYESTCICCGAERIDAYAGIYKNDSNAKKQIEASAKIVSDYVAKHTELKSTASNMDTMKVNDSGVIGFDISNVNIGDLDGSTNRKLADNFGDYTFTYDSATYKTDKGATAKKAIEAQADNIYNSDPEYIYELGPTAIKAIQDYNQSHPYGIDPATVKVYDQYTVVPVSTCSGADCKWYKSGDRKEYVSNYVTFAHIGSGFLEDVAKDFVPSGYTTLAASDNVCSILDTEAKANPLKVADMVKKDKCRWIDYIQTTGNTDKTVNTYKNVNNPVQEIPAYFRLAYK